MIKYCYNKFLFKKSFIIFDYFVKMENNLIDDENEGEYIIDWMYTEHYGSSWKILSNEDSKLIEAGYQLYLSDKHIDKRLYECFDRVDVIINFGEMKTSCGSAHCIANHDKYLDNNHMTFRLKRRTIRTA